MKLNKKLVLFLIVDFCIAAVIVAVVLARSN